MRLIPKSPRTSMLLGLAASMFVFAFTGSVALAASGWSTSGTQVINPAGAQYVITGINWYGFETTTYVAHGMYAQNYTTILDTVKSSGFNTVRLPFSNYMWESDPTPGANAISACPNCKGKHSRDIMALILNYAGSIGLHVILDNHRSDAGNSAEANGLWYYSSGSSNFPESSWINDWVNIQRWLHGTQMTSGSADTITVTYLASDGFPTVIGFDLRNEPHTVCTHTGCNYSGGSTWGSGDGISPATNPNPNPFAPACVATGSCHDWRLAAERAGDSVFGDAAAKGWLYPLIFVEGISQYPTASGTQSAGPYDYTFWGEELLGVNGNANNSGAPVVLNAGGNSTSLGASVAGKVVYSAHDYGPSEYQQPWFNTSTCYTSGCSTSSLADFWNQHWGYIAAAQVNPVWPGHTGYPWSNTGTTAYTSAPVWVGEFGTGNSSSDLYSSGNGSQGQWFTDLINFINYSNGAAQGNSGLAAQPTNLNFTYWSLNTEDSYGLLGTSYTGYAYPPKEYSFLCFAERGPIALQQGSGNGQCGYTGALPAPQ